MNIKLIVAVDEDYGIGKNNDLMWHLPADMKFFRETTSGHVVVMGRKNYESIPEKFRPLPNRENVVLTRNAQFQAPGCLVFHSLEACLQHYSETDKTVFIIGGGQIYQEALDAGVVEEMWITHVAKTFGADTFFPRFDEAVWNAEMIVKHPIDEKNAFAFEIVRYESKS